ncbi:MAG: hypothetical protein HYV93_01705 [Candidatus Rokubacteria bacterium]|nr:hypothetical protein [Candidatus Rokubacteria bacterium]
MKKQYDFRSGRRGAVLRAPSGKTRITIRIDDDVLQWFQYHLGAAAARTGDKDPARKALAFAAGSPSTFMGKDKATRMLAELR